MIFPMGRDRTGFSPSRISQATPLIACRIAVQDFPPEARSRDSDPVALSWDRREVADHEEEIIRGFPSAQETDDALFPVMKVDPLKSVPGKIELVQGAFRPVKMVQIFHPLLNPLLKRVL